jgi:uroporphyrinogen decarboxylase
VPLIGFAGAPWTMMSYAVEGKTSKSFENARRMLYEAPALAHALLEKITETTIAYLRAQVAAGAQALQLFESWAGALGRAAFDAFAMPYVRRIVEALRPSGVPFIYFVNEIAAHLPQAASSGADVLGVDFRLPIDEIRARIGAPGEKLVLQGNLDPCALFAPVEEIEKLAADVIRRAGPRHVFNLGHGITPPTPVEHTQALVEFVHRYGALRV